MKKKIYYIFAAALVLAVAGLVVYAQMNDHNNNPENLASANITEDMLPEFTLDDTPDLPDPAEKQISVDPNYKYAEPDERFFKTISYKDDIFPSERKYELITLENGDAIMLDVMLNENRIKAVKAYPLTTDVLRKAGYITPAPPSTVMDDYMLLKENNTKMYLYRLAYLNKETGEEKDIAYISGPVIDDEIIDGYKVPSKLVIYDAFIKDDLSELKLLAGQRNGIWSFVFKPMAILQKAEDDEYFKLERQKECIFSRVFGAGVGNIEARFLTPGIISITREYEDYDKSVITEKYHVMPNVIKSSPESKAVLCYKLLWCNEYCNRYTFNWLRELYGFRDNNDYVMPNDKEIAAFRQKHGFTDSSEPSYDMNEWYGWTRMNRDTSWLKD